MKSFLIEKMKHDTILVVSFLLAVVSCFFVLPDEGYFAYINYRVLAILFSLMLCVQGLVNIGCFSYLTQKLLGTLDSERKLSHLLCLLSFFSSMLITNDVALVTLVPFAILVLSAFHDARRLKYTLILMTAAANLGSMLTPIGNPQNLYLYTEYGLSAGEFILLMLPYSLASLFFIFLLVMLLNKTDHTADTALSESVTRPDAKHVYLYLALFLACILTVAGVLHYLILLAAISAVMFFFDKKAFLGVDYSLLFTFTFFFILIGNLGRIGVIRDTLSGLVSGHEVATAILSSQLISNVPAAMLLSAFTENGRALAVGINLGGLGTLIASMASLITFKFYAGYVREKASPAPDTPNAGARRAPHKKKEGGSYLLSFTFISLILLSGLLLLHFLLQQFSL